MTPFKTLGSLALAATLFILPACGANTAADSDDQSGVTALAGDPWPAIARSAWTLTDLDGAAPIEGTDITLGFNDKDDRVHGNAGANNYMGGFTHAGLGQLTFTPLATTQMYRADPPGTMEQEARYLKLLQRVDGYQLNGQNLALLSGDHVILTYSRVASP